MSLFDIYNYKSIGRTYTPIEEAPHLYEGCSLQDKRIHSACMRCMRILIELITISETVHPETPLSYHNFPAHKQGPRSTIPGIHSSHNSGASNLRDNNLLNRIVDLVVELGCFATPEDEQLLTNCYQDTKENLENRIHAGDSPVGKGDSTLHGPAQDDSSCTTLPRPDNLINHKRLEKLFRPLVESLYPKVAKGEISVVDAYLEIESFIVDYFTKAVNQCDERIMLIKELNSCENYIFSLKKQINKIYNSTDNIPGSLREKSLIVEREVEKLRTKEIHTFEENLKNIIQTQKLLQESNEGSPVTRISSRVTRLIQSYSSSKTYKVYKAWYYLVNSEKIYTTRGNTYKAIRLKRQSQIDHYHSLKEVNALSAWASQETRELISSLIPSDPEEQKMMKSRLLSQLPLPPDSTPPRDVYSALSVPVSAEDRKKLEESPKHSVKAPVGPITRSKRSYSNAFGSSIFV